MASFVKVMDAKDLPIGKSAIVTAGDEEIALFNYKGKFYAIGNQCLHQGSSLGEGRIEEGVVICYKHEWRYDLETGECPQNPNLFAKVFPVKIVKGKIFGNNLSGLKFAVWGLSFKPETDDIRESPSIELIKSLNRAGATVSAYDPKAINQFKQAMPKNQPLLTYTESRDLCIEGADALVVMTEWSEFQVSDFNFIKSALKTPIIFDARNS